MKMKDNIKLTRKQRAFADSLLANPKDTGAKAVLNSYDVTSKEVAKVIAHQNLQKPNIQAYLELHANKALQDNLEIAEYAKQYGKEGGKEGASYSSVASSINKDILDRTYGRARQQVEMTSTSLNLTIDLTSSLSVNNEGGEEI